LSFQTHRRGRITASTQKPGKLMAKFRQSFILGLGNWRIARGGSGSCSHPCS
jgi:hypothetical protein